MKRNTDNKNIKNSSFDSFSLYTLKSKLLNQQQNHSPHSKRKHKKY